MSSGPVNPFPVGPDPFFLGAAALQSAWQSVGNATSWGLQFFITTCLALCLPMQYWPQFITFAADLMLALLNPLVGQSALQPVYNFFNGTDFADLCPLVMYLLGEFTVYPVVYWVITALWWWFLQCLYIKFLMWGYHQFWGSD